jgi:hypothetical protein
MGKKDALSKILALAGAVLVWLPILAPAVFCLIVLIRSGGFHFDYLMPAELFPAVLIGGGLLLWAALRAHMQRKMIGCSLGAIIASLIGAQALAVVTGLASGAAEPEGLPWIAVLALLAFFWAALLILGVGGLMLLRNAFAPSRPEFAG